LWIPGEFLVVHPEQRTEPVAERTYTVLEDDIDGGEAAEKIHFGLDGAQYEIDLSEDNAAKLRDALAPYVAHARRADRRSSPRGSRSSAGRPGRGRERGAGSPAEIRTWARENGWDVPARGRVSSEVRAAYEAAH
jgi:hypothetical protein